MPSQVHPTSYDPWWKQCHRLVKPLTHYPSGHLPTQLGLLTELVSIMFEENSFSGAIPTQLGNLRELTGEFNFASNGSYHSLNLPEHRHPAQCTRPNENAYDAPPQSSRQFPPRSARSANRLAVLYPSIYKRFVGT